MSVVDLQDVSTIVLNEVIHLADDVVHLVLLNDPTDYIREFVLVLICGHNTVSLWNENASCPS